MECPSLYQFPASLDSEGNVCGSNRLVIFDDVRARGEMPPLVVVVGMALLSAVGLEVGGLKFATAEINATRLNNLVYFNNSQVKPVTPSLCRFMNGVV